MLLLLNPYNYVDNNVIITKLVFNLKYTDRYSLWSINSKVIFISIKYILKQICRIIEPWTII